MRHPNIAAVIGCVVTRSYDPLLVMEFYPRGTLYDLLHNKSILIEPEQLVRIIRGVVAGMVFLHSQPKPVVHGDLK